MKITLLYCITPVDRMIDKFIKIKIIEGNESLFSTFMFSLTNDFYLIILRRGHSTIL